MTASTDDNASGDIPAGDRSADGHLTADPSAAGHTPARHLAATPAAAGRWTVVRSLVLIVVVCAVVLSFRTLGDELTLAKLASRESAFRQFHADHPVLVYVAAFFAYVTVAGLSLPGATVLTIVFGWLFGLWKALLVVSPGSTAGATVAFLLSRYLFRDSITRRFGNRLRVFNDALQKEGAFYLFTLRLIPAVPFFVINAVMGLTPVRIWTFWWVSQLGMLPGTVVYVYAGASVPRLQTLAEKGLYAAFTPAQFTQILVAFALLGIFPLAVRLALKHFSPPTSAAVAAGPETSSRHTEHG